MNDIFDPIQYLSLSELNKIQKDKLYIEIQKDIVTYLINCFVESLDEQEAVDLEKQLPIDHDFAKTMELIYKYRPDFEQYKEKYLENYRQQFKLQRFISCLK